MRFTPGGESLDHLNQRSTFNVRDTSQSPLETSQPESTPVARRGPPYSWSYDDDGATQLPGSVGHDGSIDIPESYPRIRASSGRRPPTLRHRSASSADLYSVEGSRLAEEDEVAAEEFASQVSAHERAEKLSRAVGSHSAPGARRPTVTRLHRGSSSPSTGAGGRPFLSTDIPLVDLNIERNHSADEDTEDDEEGPKRRRSRSNTSEAHRLVRAHKSRETDHLFRVHAPTPGSRSGQVTPIGDRDPHEYVPRPHHYRGGILSSLLRLYDEQGVGAAWGESANGPGAQTRQHRRESSVDTATGASTPRETPQDSPPSSGLNTPKPKHPKWYKSPNHSSTSLSGLVSSSTVLAQPGGAGAAPKAKRVPAGTSRHMSGSSFGAALNRLSKPRLEDEIRITVHIAETLSRQKFLVKLCRALMQYGAPTHRLEGNSPF